jgi:hypothetical protein
MNWKECRRKWFWPNLRYYPGICLEWLRKTTKKPQTGVSQSWGPDMKPGPLNTKHECYLLDHDNCSLHIKLKNLMVWNLTLNTPFLTWLTVSKQSDKIISLYMVNVVKKCALGPLLWCQVNSVLTENFN